MGWGEHLRAGQEGEVTLPESLREALGIKGEVLVINAGDHIVLIPLPSDPFEVFEGSLNLGKLFRELRRQAELLAERKAKAEEGHAEQF